MNYIVPAMIVMSVLMLVGFVFIAYYLYINTQRKTSMINLFAQKENEIMDLYNSLEKMIEEIDRFVYQSKLELEEEKNKFLEQFSEIPLSHVQKKGEMDVQTVIPSPKESSVVSAIRENDLNGQLEIISVDVEKENSRVENSDKTKLMQKIAGMRDNKDGKILSLYNQGVSIQNIAKMMSMGHGEVQLLINLKNKNR